MQLQTVTLTKSFLFSLLTRLTCNFNDLNQFISVFYLNYKPDLFPQKLECNFFMFMFSHQIWSANAWGKETKSGPGSLLKNTNSMRSQL